jgi:hypothetical protein
MTNHEIKMAIVGNKKAMTNLLEGYETYAVLIMHNLITDDVTFEQVTEVENELIAASSIKIKRNS